MNESFQQEQASDPVKKFSWDTVKHTPEEDIVVHRGEGSEYDLRTFKADMPGLTEHVKKFEKEGWIVVNRGDFVVLERDHKQIKESTH